MNKLFLNVRWPKSGQSSFSLSEKRFGLRREAVVVEFMRVVIAAGFAGVRQRWFIFESEVKLIWTMRVHHRLLGGNGRQRTVARQNLARVAHAGPDLHKDVARHTSIISLKW